MHPTAARELPADQAAWAFEPKWDGYRALGHVVAGGLALRSRNGVDMAGWFPELARPAAALGDHAAVLDGEVVAIDPAAGPASRPCAGPGPGADDPALVFVRPELAVEVSFLGWESGRLRHPAYSGLSRIL